MSFLFILIYNNLKDKTFEDCITYW